MKEKSDIIIKYIIINIIFVLPMVIFDMIGYFFSEMYVPWFYVALMMFYYLYKFTYVHIILCAALLIYCIKLRTGKNISLCIYCLHL